MKLDDIIEEAIPNNETEEFNQSLEMKDSVPLRNFFNELEDILGPAEFSKETS